MSCKNISPVVTTDCITIQRQLKFLIYFEAAIGVNRLYVLGRSRLCSICVTAFNFVIFIIASSIYNLSGLHNNSQSIYKNSQLTEYFMLCICAVFVQRRSLEIFFRCLFNIDALLNIQKDILLVTPRSEHLVFLLVLCICNTLDFIFSFKYFHHPSYNIYSYVVSFLTILVNDIEVLFYCTLLAMVLKRLTIIHAHVAQEYTEMNISDKLTIFTQKTKPDVSSLHKIYEMLHHSSSVLEKIVGFPLLLMFAANGVITIMLLRDVLNAHMVAVLPLEGARYLWIYATMKCMKNGILLLIPCYYGSSTVRQARSVRHALKRGLAITKCDIRKRRQLKAFYQLTRDNEFAYTLWASIRLDMALPLNYYYMCLTYFIIVVQFAKFFD